jgi:hypothetical protein
MNDAQPWLAHDERVEPCAGVVGARVVDRDDLELRIVLIEQRANGLLDVGAFVVAWDEKGHRGQLRELRRIVGTTVLGLLAIEEVIGGTRRPDVRHEQRVVEREVKERMDYRFERHRRNPRGNDAIESPCRSSPSSGWSCT